jgi:hypothetical protein
VLWAKDIIKKDAIIFRQSLTLRSMRTSSPDREKPYVKATTQQQADRNLLSDFNIEPDAITPFVPVQPHKKNPLWSSTMDQPMNLPSRF